MAPTPPARTALATRSVILPALAAVALLAGCATPGPLHVYSFVDDDRKTIRDAAPDGAASGVPSFLEEQDRISGLAYDPFTDHFFLRLEPGSRIRVVDRPARAIKREFTIDGAPDSGGGDLAIRPRDGHVFLLHPTEPAVLETTRLGLFRRTIRLAGANAAGLAIAYDASQDRLLVLQRDGTRISAFTPAGDALGGFTLERKVGSSLACDGARRELYAPLAEDGAIAVFDVSGKLLRVLLQRGRFVEVGERSLIRVF